MKKSSSILLTVMLIVALVFPSSIHARAMIQREGADFLLHWIGYTDEEITSGGGVDQSAISIGLVDESTYQPEEVCTNDQFEAMRQIALELYDVKPPIPEYKPVDPTPPEPPVENTPMKFENGIAQPVFNIKNDIARFCVYVETDYDTDDDGKLDLIKVVVQLPKEAMNGNYKAGVIYEARPYIAGTGYTFSGSGSYAESNLYKKASPRTVKGSTTTAEVAKEAKSSEYSFYENLDWYDYFLVRGFAVVTAAGLGTKGSEGFETCGTDLEIDAFASVIEWLNGSPDAVAYTNRTDNIKVDADWCNKKVGMTGRSYAGTTQFGIAGTGVEGLETIVPVSGIASWYEYSNSQGYRTRAKKDYSKWLASYCASRKGDSGFNETRYAQYLNTIGNDEIKLNGDYGEHFKKRDYTLNPNIKCSALIVHGLNDNNVRTKHFQMMYDAFKNAGKDVKLLLHQDGHVTPAYGANKTEQFINGEAYQQVINRWFSHYLYDINNGVENMPTVTAQNNLDGSKWKTYDRWETNKNLTMNSSTKKINEKLTIQGTIPVKVKAIPNSSSSNQLLHVQLVDTSSNSFNAFQNAQKYNDSFHSYTGNKFVVGGGAQDYEIVTLRGENVKSKIIAEGWIDLANPSAGFASSSAKKESIKKGKEYEYTVYLQPTVYEVAPGHTLKLEVSASKGTVKSYSASIPVSDDTSVANSYSVRYETSANGTITSNVANGEVVDANTRVTLRAKPNNGYKFSSWVVNGKKVSNKPTTTFTIRDDTSITCEFKRKQKNRMPINLTNLYFDKLGIDYFFKDLIS